MESQGQPEMAVAICPVCAKPTFFLYTEQISPRPRPGEPVRELPEKVEAIYQEARSAMQAGAYTGATLLLRSLLAHVAAEKGGDPKVSFAKHVKFLVEQGILPPMTGELMDAIRVAGNEVAHDLVIATEDDVLHLMTFATHALRSVYELPAKLTQLKAKP